MEVSLNQIILTVLTINILTAIYFAFNFVVEFY